MTKTRAIGTGPLTPRPSPGQQSKQSPSTVRGFPPFVVVLSVVASLVGGGFLIAWHVKEKPDLVVREAVAPNAMTPSSSSPQVFEFKVDDRTQRRRYREVEVLRLFEEGVPLRLAGESGVMDAGARGLYAHDGHAVTFSASDGSDPRTNARSYAVSYLAGPSHPLLAAIGIGLLLASLVIALWGVVAVVRGRPWHATSLRGVTVLLLAPFLLPSLFIVNQIYHIYPKAVIRGLAVVEPDAVRFDQFPNNRYCYLYLFTKAPQYSDVRLSEDEIALGPSQGTTYTSILERGEGRYKRYNQQLYFSSSDGTDPRESRRIYTLSYPAFVSNPLVNVVGTALFLVTVAWLCALGWQRMREAETNGSTHAVVAYAGLSVALCVLHLLLIDENATRSIAPNLLLATLLPLPGLRFGKGVGRAVAVLVVFTAFFGVVMTKWQQGVSDGLMLGGLFPWADGNGYLQGAFQALNGETMDPFSSRRPIHPLTIGLLLAVANADIQLVIVLQTLLVAVAVVFLAWVLARRSSLIVAFFLLLAVLLFSKRFLGTTWTETSGILWGCLATGFLIEAACDRRWLLGAVSIFLLSWALSARAGAMFVIPLACLWLAWEHGVAWRPRVRRLVIYVGFAAIPFVATSAIVAEFGNKYGVPFGNYPLTLYGTLTGGNWRSALREPEFAGLQEREQAVAVMRASKAIIVEDPTTLLRGIQRAYVEFQPWAFVGPVPLRWSLNLLSLLGLLMSLLSFRRNALSRFMIVGAVGVFLSVPFAPPWDSDGMRVYAATLPMAGVLIGWGITLLFSMRVDALETTQLRPATILVPMVITGLIAFMPLLYKTVLSREPISQLAHEQRVLTFLPLDGSTLHIVADGRIATSLRPLEIEEGRFDRELALMARSYSEVAHYLRSISRPGVSLYWGEGFIPVIIPSERLENASSERVVVSGAVIRLAGAPRFFVEASLLNASSTHEPHQ